MLFLFFALEPILKGSKLIYHLLSAVCFQPENDIHFMSAKPWGREQQQTEGWGKRLMSLHEIQQLKNF
jgi:hypothetical protein